MMELKAIRKKKQLTQRELASMCGVSWQLISMIERGERNVTVKTAKLLSPVLGVAWHKLIDKETA